MTRIKAGTLLTSRANKRLFKLLQNLGFLKLSFQDHMGYGTGIKAKVQAEFGREGAGIPGCPTGMRLQMQTLTLNEGIFCTVSEL